MSTKKKKPMFEHDCKECTFLGTEKRKDGTTVDLWIHVNPEHYSIIARRSDEPADYSCRVVTRKADYI